LILTEYQAKSISQAQRKNASGRECAEAHEQSQDIRRNTAMRQKHIVNQFKFGAMEFGFRRV